MTIHGVAIGIPAHNEAARIGRTLTSVLRAARGTTPVVIVVAADACTDASARIATEQLRDTPSNIETQVIRVNHRQAGAAREAACRTAHAQLEQRIGAGAPSWIATTDADSVVPVDWLAIHRRWAGTGAHAVAGLVRTDPRDPLLPTVRVDIERELAEDPATHFHVFGANLAIEATWWRTVGGFPRVAVGEDRLIVEKLQAAGACVVSASDSIVTTSARLTPRAPRGFGAHLAAMTARASDARPTDTDPAGITSGTHLALRVGYGSAVLDRALGNTNPV